jgi:Uma2 family endonuclease
MSTTSTSTTTQRGAARTVYRISVDEYERLVAAGVLNDPRVELIDGLLVQKPRKNPAHVASVKSLGRYLERMVPPGWHVGKDDPVRIAEYHQPAPDLAIVAGAAGDYRSGHPEAGDVALMVEIAAAPLESDLSQRLSACAASGIPICWIVNLADRRVEAYSQPSPGGYRQRQAYAPGQDIPLVVAGVECGRVCVAEILP